METSTQAQNIQANDITVRVATISDASVLAELGARAFYDTYAKDNTPENMQAYLTTYFGIAQQTQELTDSKCFILIAEINGSLAGYAKLLDSEPASCVTGKQPLELARIYSAKEWIGKGVGPALIQGCLDEAQRRGYDVLWLGVWEQNPRGRAFYQKWGFVEVGTQIFQLGDDPQRDFVMQRSVTGILGKA